MKPTKAGWYLILAIVMLQGCASDYQSLEKRVSDLESRPAREVVIQPQYANPTFPQPEQKAFIRQGNEVIPLPFDMGHGAFIITNQTLQFVTNINCKTK